MIRWQVAEEVTRVRPTHLVAAGDDVAPLIRDLRDYVAAYRATNCDSFWRRKSGKVVLAVLMIRWEGRLEFFRGINSEISLPVGSNCAERSAISAALTGHLGIRRENFKAIAVVDPDDSPEHLNPVSPCGVCEEWLKKIQEAAPHFVTLGFSSANLEETIERFPILREVGRSLPPASWRMGSTVAAPAAGSGSRSPIAKPPRPRRPRRLKTAAAAATEAKQPDSSSPVGNGKLPATASRRRRHI